MLPVMAQDQESSVEATELETVEPVVTKHEIANPTLNRRGIALLPKAGDFALGIEANPFLEYLGNLYTGAGAPTFSGVNQTIYGKYFLEDNVALRAKLRLNFSETKYKETIADDYAIVADPTNVDATAVDVQSEITRFIGLNLGIEFRRGKGRIQGFYGAEVNLGYGQDKTKYDYANAITAANTNPTTANFGSNTAPTGSGYRVLSNNQGATFSIGLGGFVGVEYFIAPQLSIGGELGLNFNYAIKGQDKTTAEGILNGAQHEWNYRSRNQADVSFDTGIRTVAVGQIFLLFHF
jgi:hypothetical protein